MSELKINTDANNNKCNGNEYHIFEVNDMLKLDAKTDLMLSRPNNKYFVGMNVNNVDIDFELDTGAAVTCVGEFTYKKFCIPGEKLFSSNITLTDYNKQPLEILGVAMVKVKYFSQCKILPVVVIKGNRASLLGRNWLNVIKIGWSSVFNLNKSTVHSVNDIESSQWRS